jgi:hypothetical protein
MRKPHAAKIEITKIAADVSGAFFGALHIRNALSRRAGKTRGPNIRHGAPDHARRRSMLGSCVATLLLVCLRPFSSEKSGKTAWKQSNLGWRGFLGIFRPWNPRIRTV